MCYTERWWCWDGAFVHLAKSCHVWAAEKFMRKRIMTCAGLAATETVGQMGGMVVAAVVAGGDGGSGGSGGQNWEKAIERRTECDPNTHIPPLEGLQRHFYHNLHSNY